MTTVFGQVAQLYDDVRPGYPAEVAQRIAGYAQPESVTEIGAGTGHGTAVLATLGVPITCVEPDERMAAVLAWRFPQARIVISAFERWRPPPGGVPMLACALAWHWLDEHTRCRLAHDALADDGTLVVWGHVYGFADAGQRTALDAAFDDPPAPNRRTDGWIERDITASGLFTRITSAEIVTELSMPTERYLRLVQTFGPFRRRDPHTQRQVLHRVRAAVDGFGGAVAIRLETTLVLAAKIPR